MAFKLPFRIPFFRIFYSTTYTTIYFICICFLSITPISMMYQAIVNLALQYVVIIGGTLVLTLSIAIFILASRLFTNRTVMAGVGKAYIPVEPGEVGTSIRRMIVHQYERSAMIAWESRPRDLLGEILQAEQLGTLPPETRSVDRHDYTVGREISVDPSAPPWGDVQHLGWSSPAHRDENEIPHLHFAPVVEELPNLIEAKAVSLTPPDPTAVRTNSMAPGDPLVFEILRRPETTGMRDYLTQLSYLGLVNPPEVGLRFLQKYENARFSGLPLSEAEFKSLMASFSDLLAGMVELQPDMVDEIRTQKRATSDVDLDEQLLEADVIEASRDHSSPTRSPQSDMISPVASRSAPSGNGTSYAQHESMSDDDKISAMRQPTKEAIPEASPTYQRRSQDSSSLESLGSDSGSVLRHSSSP